MSADERPVSTNDTRGGTRRAVTTARGRVEAWLSGERHGLRALSVLRMAMGLSVLGLLLSNFGSRQSWVGEASVWAEPAREASSFPELGVLDGVSGDLLTLVYVIVMAAALALVVGWRTKAANVVTLLGFIAVTGQNPVVASPGDDLIRIALLWMVLMRTGEHWSLDAARDSREDVVPEWLGATLHNVGLLGLATQVALTYLAAGLDKVSDPTWQHGTALYSTFQLPEFRPFPWLADLVSGSSLLLALLTWTVLVVQLFFVPLLLHPITRHVVVAAAVLVNVFFAIVVAVPWSSLAVVAVTGLFVSEPVYARIGAGVAELAAPAADRIIVSWYAVADRVEDAWFRFGLPVVDWVLITVLRR